MTFDCGIFSEALVHSAVYVSNLDALDGNRVQIPQFVLNIKRQSVEALSSWFLAQWLLGDTCNLVGCLLTGSQLPTQTWTAGYFICTDM